MRILLTLFLVSLTLSCKNEKKESQISQPENATTEIEKTEEIETDTVENTAGSVEELFTKTVENAHKKKEFLKKEAVKFDIQLNFNNQERLNATITMFTNSSKILIQKKNGDQLLYDGERVYLTPRKAKDKGARFDMFTWTYFFGLPYKLNDPGTKWAMEQDRTLEKDGVEYSTAKLTFGENVGDAPDDWYLIYRDPSTQLIKSAVYIVTYGSNGDISKAEANPHAIVYNTYEEVAGIPIATSWSFHDWTAERGLGKQLGDAAISNISFLQVNPETFLPSNNSKTISQP